MRCYSKYSAIMICNTKILGILSLAGEKAQVNSSSSRGNYSVQ